MPAINKPTMSAFQKKQKMSLSQTYYLAHTARGKLSKEASRADHDLRLLVGHANLLDGLMLDLADAERQQESWFNATVRDASSASGSNKKKTPVQEPKHITWADSLPAVDEAESDEDEFDDEMVISTATTAARPAVPAITTVELMDSEEEEEDDDEDDISLQLTRTPSRSSPPELLHAHDSEEESEDDDDDMPPSPPAPHMEFADKTAAPAKQSQDVHMTHGDALYEDGFYLPPRPQAIATY